VKSADDEQHDDRAEGQQGKPGHEDVVEEAPLGSHRDAQERRGDDVDTPDRESCVDATAGAAVGGQRYG
jgi:hypothetical protein